MLPFEVQKQPAKPLGAIKIELIASLFVHYFCAYRWPF